MGWLDINPDATDSTDGGGSPIRNFIGSGLGRFLIPLLTATAGGLQRRPGPYGTTRAAGISGAITGGLGGLDTVMSAQDQQAKYDREQRVGKYLRPEFERMAGPTTTQEPVQGPPVEEQAGNYPIATEAKTTPASERDRRLGMLGMGLLRGGQSGAAANLYAQHGLPKERTPHVFGGETGGYYEQDETGKVNPLVPGIGRKRTVGRETTNLGNEVETLLYDTESGDEISRSKRPMGSAPARQETDLQRRNTESQIAERAARTNRIKNAVDKSNDPKATLGQLSSSLNALIRERDSIETPDEDKPGLQDAVRAIRGRMTEMATQRRGGGPSPPAADALPQGVPAGSKAIGKTKAGETVYQTPDGKRVAVQ